MVIIYIATITTINRAVTGALYLEPLLAHKRVCVHCIKEQSFGATCTSLTSVLAGLFWWIHWCWIVFQLFLLIGGQLLLGFGSKATTWGSLNFCRCSWGCSTLNSILLLDWIDVLIQVIVYSCPIEVWYVTSWNTLLAESPFFT